MRRAENSKGLFLFKMTQLLSVNAEPSVVENSQNFITGWEELLAQTLLDQREDSLSEAAQETLRGLIELASLFEKEMFVLTIQEHIKCTSTCNVQCVIQDLLSQLESTSLFRQICENVCAMSSEDVLKLKRIFGAWENTQPLLKEESAGRLSLCGIEQTLCLCHFITAFLLSWPYPDGRSPQSLCAALRMFSQDVQQGGHGDNLKDEISTLHRQLSKLKDYHSHPRSPGVEKVKTNCSTGKKSDCKKAQACCAEKQS